MENRFLTEDGPGPTFQTVGRSRAQTHASVTVLFIKKKKKRQEREEREVERGRVSEPGRGGWNEHAGEQNKTMFSVQTPSIQQY